MIKKIKSSDQSNNHLSVCVLASGSKGNAIYISDGTTSILIDAGLSGREIERRCQSRGLSPKNLSAIVVSHEHNDHSHGVGVLSRRFSLPVYINKKTKQMCPQIGKIFDLRFFDCGTSFQIGQLALHPFSVSHDAEDPAGFTIGKNGRKIGLATDLGIATRMVKSHLTGCNLVILEANHDPVMLENGPYPWPLKQRIKSRTGHLSNDDSKMLLQEIQTDQLKHVILAHLSETNNTPDKALNTVNQATINPDIPISVATQDACTDIFYI